MDYYNPVDFTKTVYVIEDGVVVDIPLGELAEKWAETTTTPEGVDFKFFTKGKELWTWGVNGQYPAVVFEFDSKKEAEHAKYLTYLQDLHMNYEAPYYYTNEEDALVDLELLMEE